VEAIVEPSATAAVGVALAGVRRLLGGRVVLEGVDLDIHVNARMGIVGRSGVGKSTLLSLVGGLDRPDAGTITVGGERSANGRLARCALMPQADCLLPWRSALDNACLALENRGVGRVEARRRATDLFARVGLAGAERLRPAQLSGGMRQRVAFVRTLLAGKRVLLLDEPFGALDAITRAELQEWLRHTLADEPRTVVLVTHDVEEALFLCDTVAVLAGGRIGLRLENTVVHDGPRSEVVTDPAFLAARERLLAAIE
jgi:NitT/TauT family transport system ATP-binding protein